MTKSATPVAMALRGIEAYSASFGSCTRMMPPDFLDGAHPDGAVGSRPAQNDGKAFAELLRQRAKEQIDRRPVAARLVERKRRNLVVDHLQAAVGRNDINVVRLHPLAGGDLNDRHPRFGRQDARQFAAVLRIEMHHHDEGRAGVLRKGGKKALQRRHAARRSADGDDGRLALLARRRAARIVIGIVRHDDAPFSGRSQHIQETSRGASKFRQRRAALTRLIGPYPGAGMAPCRAVRRSTEARFAAPAPTIWRAPETPQNAIARN